jgi:soluble lytic murein transglycosylase
MAGSFHRRVRFSLWLGLRGLMPAVICLGFAAVGLWVGEHPPDGLRADASFGEVPGLTPTPHPPVPSSLERAWFVPAQSLPPTDAERALVDGIAQIGAGAFDAALKLLADPRLATSPVAAWAAYYTGVAHLRAGRPAEAARALDTFAGAPALSVTSELGGRALSEAAEAAGDLPRSLAALAPLADRPTAFPDEVLKRLAEVASKAGEGGRARAAWLRLYYDHPLSPHAALAEPIAAEARAAAGAARAEVFARDLARAEALYAARQYADARTAFERLLPDAKDDTRELVELRLAACDHAAKRYKAVLLRLEPWLQRASRQAEARYYHLAALRGLGRHSDFISRVRALVADAPDSPWSEEALNSLGTHHILANDDAAAAEAFKQIVERFPAGRHAPRAAWKYGWWQYKLGELAVAAEVFERAAMHAPRSDYRPAWLYWAGRAREALGHSAEAQARYQVAVTDYGGSYYGRMASERLPEAASTARHPNGPPPAPSDAGDSAFPVGVEATLHAAGAGSPQDDTPPASPPLPNREIIERLIVLGLWSEAALEIEHAQRTWGNSPPLQATLAYVFARQGDLRRGINTMKRAYPQYLTEGNALPREIIEVLFPVAYWDLIRKHARARNLDPHLVAALIAQESTFDRDARSAANAWGLMQILPSTGRRLARLEGIRRFTTASLRDPETNLRLGTRYLASLLKRFGDDHLALAGYNAGESRVVRWRAERPGLAKDEFIDDIPFPETQNYVKRILGTAADYRALYPLDEK